MVTRRAVLVGAGGVVAGCGRPALCPADGPPEDAPLEFSGAGATDPEVQEMGDPFSFADPVILYASTRVEAGGNGAVDSTLLMNPEGRPMELLEARFRVYPDSSGENDYRALTGMAIGVKMDLGNIPVVDADFPVSLFGTVRDSYEFGPVISPADTEISTIPTTYSWRLAHPLFIPAGATLLPVFSHLGQSAAPVNVDVMYLARVVDGFRPDIVKVPWATKYTSKSFTLAEDEPATSDASTSLDIINPFAVPLKVLRLTGRCSIFQNAAITTGAVTVANTIYEDPVQFRSRLATVQIRSSRGADIARYPVPLDGLFPFNWRAWEFPGTWEIQPSEFYNVKLSAAANPDEFATAEFVSRAQVSVGLIGYREIPRKMYVGGAS